MSTPEEEFLKSLRATFRVEADEHLQAIAAGLLGLEKPPALDEQRRLFCVIKWRAELQRLLLRNTQTRFQIGE